MPAEDETPRFFATAAAWRKWLAAHHKRQRVQWVGFHKVGSGTPSVTWPQSVAEALCYGWIDGLRRSIDAERYKIRFTPRQPSSRWSQVNLKMYAELDAAGKVRAAGRRAYEARKSEPAPQYGHEQADAAVLDPSFARRLRADRAARAYFDAQAPWYRRAAIHWVMSAKRPETRERRFATLLADCGAARTIKPLTRPVGKGSPRKKTPPTT